MPVVLSLPAGRPKRDLIDLAFDDCGLAGYEFDRTPEEQVIALRKLNALMLEEPWSDLGYRQPPYGAGQPEDQSGLPDWSINAVSQYLALRIAPGMGASLAPEQRVTMARSLMAMQSRLASIPGATMPGNTVLGQGGRYVRGRYTPRADDAPTGDLLTDNSAIVVDG